MDTRDLMSGIAVVIDDALAGPPGAGGSAAGAEDLIRQIVRWFEAEWKLPFVRMTSLPKAPLWPNLLRSASFVLLDWRLWGAGGETLKRSMIEDITVFLTTARENLVPVLILTNENPDAVAGELRKLPVDVYNEDAAGNNFVFVEQKSGFWSGTSVDVDILKGWVYGNASVYALKTWHREMDRAKSELFQAMCRRNVNWPREFWETYRTDGADPSVSLTNLINDSLLGRMRVDAFEEKHLGGQASSVSGDELRKLIAETSFRVNDVLSADEVRCGDLFKREASKYWLNLRPDCDCIPRDGSEVGDVEVYCVEGKRLGPSELYRLFKNGHFEERVSQSVVFGVVDGKSILFNFDKLRVCKYSKLRERRVGRLLHPYVTRVQQRYALFIQRQALPRIPDAAVPPSEADATS